MFEARNGKIFVFFSAEEINSLTKEAVHSTGTLLCSTKQRLQVKICHWARGSAVGGAAGRRMPAIQVHRPGLTSAKQGFYVSGIGRLLPGFSRADKVWICPSAGALIFLHRSKSTWNHSTIP